MCADQLKEANVDVDLTQLSSITIAGRLLTLTGNSGGFFLYSENALASFDVEFQFLIILVPQVDCPQDMFRLLVRAVQNIIRTLNGGTNITDEQMSASVTQSKQASFFTEEERTKDC